MKQRLGIAMALLGSPRLLILDEPTNGLDPAGIQEMRALIHDMPDACGATVLISSHLLGEMEQIVSQVGIINHGQLLFEGPLAELQRHSRGNVVLRLLAPDRGAAVLRRYGLAPQPADNGCLLPTMEDARLAALVQDLAAEGAGVWRGAADQESGRNFPEPDQHANRQGGGLTCTQASAPSCKRPAAGMI